MANPPYAAGCSGGSTDTGGSGSTLLPASPFYAPRYHFGMLLGVDDFETEQAYHRGKQRLHNAWLHGEGVVWGLRVAATERDGAPGRLTGEIRVEPGLALDAAGRELYLENPACLSLPAWYEANRQEPAVRAAVRRRDDGALEFDAHVTACFRACVARPVPAISEPCVGAGADTAYSRARETLELRLVPGAPPPRRYPYRRLRLLFALDEPVAPDRPGDAYPDSRVVADRAAVLSLAPEEQPAAYLAVFRRLAAFDEMDLVPAALRREPGESLLFPADDDTCIVLATVNGIVLRPVEDRLTLAAAVVDNTVRPSHVATSTIQELLCGPLFSLTGPPGGPGNGGGNGGDPGGNGGGGAGNGSGNGNGGEEEPEGSDGGEAVGGATGEDAGGPRFDPDSVVLEEQVITLRASIRLSKQSVTPAAFSVASYDHRSGWHDLDVTAATLDGQATKVSLELDGGIRGSLVRVVARGTGPTPLLGTNLVPLAGAVAGPAGTRHDGHDFVFMLTRSET